MSDFSRGRILVNLVLNQADESDSIGNTGNVQSDINISSVSNDTCMPIVEVRLENVPIANSVYEGEGSVLNSSNQNADLNNAQTLLSGNDIENAEILFDGFVTVADEIIKENGIDAVSLSNTTNYTVDEHCVFSSEVPLDDVDVNAGRSDFLVDKSDNENMSGNVCGNTEDVSENATLDNNCNLSDSIQLHIGHTNSASATTESDPDESVSNNLECEIPVSRKRKRKEERGRDKRKRQRNSGEPYVSDKGVLVSGKCMQPNPCSDGKCSNKCSERFTEDERQQLFKQYWNLPNSSKQRDWILSCVAQVQNKRRWTCDKARQRETRCYSFPSKGKRINVCFKFFLKTLNISAKTVRYAWENKTDISSAKPDERGKKEPANKTPTSVTQNIHTFIQKLPAMPSHYCRSSSTKTYIPTEYKSLENVYRLYKKECQDKEVTFAKAGVFKNVWKENYNIGIHIPKKDKCAICLAHEQGRLENGGFSNEKFEDHIREKEATKVHFLHDQKLSGTEGFLCASFDLQKVLNTPHGDNMLLYYSRKYAVYNFTVYENQTRKVYCYVWGESDGNRGCNEIASMLHMYINRVDSNKSVTTLSLYCDSCPGQNKNHVILSMIAYTLQNSTTLTSITVNYLLPGHTYMPVDSVHGAIERSLKHRVVWAPSEWPTWIENARTSQEPYVVHVMNHADFKDWRPVEKKFFPPQRKEHISGDKIKFQEIRQAKFVKHCATVDIQYSFSEGSESLAVSIGPHKGRGRPRQEEICELNQLHKARLPISAQKYKDLRQLCERNIIPQRCWNEYQKIPWKGSVRDCLAESDEDDADELV